jgi:hypothetical protein
VLFFSFTRFSEATEKDEAIAAYIKDISSIMTDVDITMRGIGMNTFPLREGVRRLDGYIFRLEFSEYPEDLSKQRKMVLLSFKKIRKGLLLMSSERRDVSIGLIKSGTRLLKSAATDIVDIAKKQGLVKKK